MHQNYSQTHNELLKTIIFPKNMNFAKSTLPKPQYEQIMKDETDKDLSLKQPNSQLSQMNTLVTKDSSKVSIFKLKANNKTSNQSN